MKKASKKPKQKDLPDITTPPPDDLPQGWIEAALEGLVYLAGRIGWRGLTAAEYTEDGPIFLSVLNLNYGDEVDFREVNHISRERYEESPEIQLQNDDNLLTKDGAGIGKLGFVANLPGPATINSSLLLIRSLGVFEPRYLFYCLKAPEFQGLAQQRITTSQPMWNGYKDVRFPTS